MASNTLAVGIQRDNQFWYKNGDVVLIASHKIAFKIYIEILSRESTVFRDLVNQDVPRPEEQEMMDNCPVVHLTDEPDDLRIFLTLIYDGWRVRKDKNHRTWPFVKVMITLGDKYHTPEFYNAGIELLNLTFPRVMTQWDSNNRLHDPKRIRFAPQDAVSMANVTRNLDPDLHAVTLYLCCSLPVATLSSGLICTGEGLLPEVLHRCLQGKEHIEMSRYDIIRDVLDIPSQDACAQRFCGKNFARLRASDFAVSRARMDYANNTTNDLLDWSFWIDTVLSGIQAAGVCPVCIEQCAKGAFNARQALRDGLQKRFGLDQTPAERHTDESAI